MTTQLSAYPHGRFRRLIDLRSPDDHAVVGWLEDDFHHFGLRMREEQGVVADVELIAKRLPYSTCGGAVAPLKAVIGTRLPVARNDVSALGPATLQCTHMFHMAGLMLAHLSAGRRHRRYEAIVEDRAMLQGDGAIPVFGEGRAQLRRDDAPLLDWRLNGETIVSPPPFAGRSYLRGFRNWRDELAADTAEAALVLQSAIFIAGGRSMGPPATPRRRPIAVCYTYQPGRVGDAVGTQDVRDWSAGAEGMLSALDAFA